MERAVGFWEAWQLWAAGSPIQPLVLWGQPILWWGRIGKIAQFAAGLVIILDLVGAERLRAWAHRSTSVVGERLRQLRNLATRDAWSDFLWNVPPSGRGLSSLTGGTWSSIG